MQSVMTNLRLWKPEDTIWEIGAKVGATLSLISLGTAFIYDAVYYRELDARLLSVFVLQDHIETAIYCVPTVLIGALMYVFIAPLLSWRFVKIVFAYENRMSLKAYKAFLIGIIVACASILILLWMVLWFTSADKPESIGHPMLGAEPFWEKIVGLIPILVVSTWMTVRTKASDKLQRVIAEAILILPVFWLITTVLLAVTFANATNRELSSGILRRFDTITIDDRGQLFGKVIRVVDKGLILGALGPDHFIFIPKDKIQRIDLASR